MPSEVRFTSTHFRPVIAGSKPKDLMPLDLSVQTSAFSVDCLKDPVKMEREINELLEKAGKTVAYGGYLERRKLYERSSHFTSSKEKRSIHLGVDFWCKKETLIKAPENGTIHSIGVNDNFGDYGPTIILEHSDKFGHFYSLYGHLSESCLKSVRVGDRVKEGEVFAEIGGFDENGSYAPHLHFQLIINIEGKQGDYPGVCADKDLVFYKQNCPNPISYLGLG